MKDLKPANSPDGQTPETPRAWVTPTFKSAPLQEAMSGETGEGSDNIYFS